MCVYLQNPERDKAQVTINPVKVNTQLRPDQVFVKVENELQFSEPQSLGTEETVQIKNLKDGDFRNSCDRSIQQSRKRGCGKELFPEHDSSKTVVIMKSEDLSYEAPDQFNSGGDNFLISESVDNLNSMENVGMNVEENEIYNNDQSDVLTEYSNSSNFVEDFVSSQNMMHSSRTSDIHDEEEDVILLSDDSDSEVSTPTKRHVPSGSSEINRANVRNLGRTVSRSVVQGRGRGSNVPGTSQR